MLLAASGAEVVVHERLSRIGGRSGTLRGAGPDGGYRFDIGPTFFLYPRILEEIFAACGADLHAEVELIRLDPQYELVFDGGQRLAASGDPAALAEAVAAFSPRDAANISRYMADNRAKLDAFTPILEQPFTRVVNYLRPGVLRALPSMRPLSTVDRDLGRYFSDERVRLAFSFQSKYLGMSPFRCPSLFTILAFMEYEYGVWHPRGGCGAVMAAMARVAGRMGVRIHLDDPVEEVLTERGRAVGLRFADRSERYDALFINADFAHAMKTLVPDTARRRWTDKRIEKRTFSCSTFMLYLGIEGRLDDIGHHTVFLSGDYRRNIAEIEAGQVPPGEPSFYVQNASVTDPSLAPPGHSTLYVLVPVGHNRVGGIDWQAEQAGFRRLALDRLAQVGLPDIEPRIRYEKMLTPLDWETEMAIHKGATFNLAHSLDQMLMFRPHNRFEDLDGVYLVGGGTHPGSGLPTIFQSARISSRLAAEDLGLDGVALPPARARPPLLEPAVVEAL
jgi:phytoene desaturase